MPITPAKREKGAGHSAESHAAHGPARVAAVTSRPDGDMPVRPRGCGARSNSGQVAGLGVYQPRRDLAVGSGSLRVHRIGTVNVLGVNRRGLTRGRRHRLEHAEAGEAVEYGQELVRIELPMVRPGANRGPESEPAGAAGSV